MSYAYLTNPPCRKHELLSKGPTNGALSLVVSYLDSLKPRNLSNLFFHVFKLSFILLRCAGNADDFTRDWVTSTYPTLGCEVHMIQDYCNYFSC